MSLETGIRDVQDQRERRSTASFFHLGVLVVAVTVVAVACRDVKPTESARGIGVTLKPVCFSNGISCICAPGTVGTWPNCTAEEPPPLVTGDTAKVWCTPHTVTRGMSIQCRIYVGRQRQFRIRLRTSSSRDTLLAFQKIAPRDDSLYQAGDTARWNGRMVVSSLVTVNVGMSDSTGLVFNTLPITTDTIAVHARVWPAYQITEPPSEQQRVVWPMTAYPAHYKPGTDTVDVVVGTFQFADRLFDQFFSIAYLGTGTGPNDGIAYVSVPPPLGQHTVTSIHPALSPPSGPIVWDDPFSLAAFIWYFQQDGKSFLWPMTTHSVAACDSAGVARLRIQDRGHEGVADIPTNSHFSILRDDVSVMPIAALIEGSVFIDSLTYLLFMQDRIDTLVYQPIQRREEAFENPEYLRIFGGPFHWGVVPTNFGAIQCHTNEPGFRPPTR